MVKAFENYMTFLIHPFKTHEQLLLEEDSKLRLTPYESLTVSWVFVIFNGLCRIILLNMLLHFFISFFQSEVPYVSDIIDLNQFSAFYVFILSAIMDIIFYPLFGLFLIQFWTFIINMFGQLLGEEQNLVQKTEDIISVYLSSHFLRIIPFIGDSLQGLIALILLYSGMRIQLKASPLLSFCIVMTPVLLLLMLLSIILILVASFIG